MKTLEELKQAMMAAQSAMDEKPDDEALKTAFAEAKAAYDERLEAEDEPEEFDESKADERTKKYIAKLRKENGTHRTKSKDLKSEVLAEKAKVKAILKAAGIESEDEAPEVKLKAATQQTQSLAFENAILKEAVKHGIPGDQTDYFEFLITKATNDLDEGEELPEAKLAEIVAKVKKTSGKKANSSVDGAGGSGTPPASQNGDKITLEKFCSMGIMAKSKLYQENPDLYASLAAEAKTKKKLV